MTPPANNFASRPLLRLCRHEAGHALVAGHFGVEWAAWVIPAAAPGGPQHAGTRFGSATPLHSAAIAWAGALAELDPAATFSEAESETIAACVSVSDWNIICAHPDPFESLTLAASILRQHAGQLAHLAGRLLAEKFCSHPGIAAPLQCPHPNPEPNHAPEQSTPARL